MSLLNWLFPAKRNQAPGTSPPAGAQRRTGAKDAAAAAGGDSSSRRKVERATRRELLYAVVREAMVRAGVLSASYTFKVLSLDGDGRQFMVMIDLGRDASLQPGELHETEALIAQSAKSRHELLVTAVYWRSSEQAAASRGRAGQQPGRFSDSQPMPLDSHPAPLHSAPVPLTPSAPLGRPAYEPIQADEVAAFKKALIEGTSGHAPLSPSADKKGSVLDPKAAHGPRSYTLLTGFEDTEMHENDGKGPVLSGTQYGELR